MTANSRTATALFDDWEAMFRQAVPTSTNKASVVQDVPDSLELESSVDGTAITAPKTASTSSAKAPPRPRTPVTVLAEWNGCVERIDTNYFSATLRGISGEGVEGADEEAELPISDIAESDKELFLPGNFFRLSVCYETREDGQPRRYTQVVFRRLPAYRAADLAKAAERALELSRNVRVE